MTTIGFSGGCVVVYSINSTERVNLMKKKVISAFEILLALVTFVGLIKAIFIGLDIDESYSVALAYRLSKGDRLVKYMWEPHQFSAIFTNIFLNLYTIVTGTYEYSVIFLRGVSVIIHLGLGFFLYKFTTERYGLNAFTGFLISLIHVNFLPKWIQSTEFELVTYWSFLTIFLLVSEYFIRERDWKYLFFAGVFAGFLVLCYPTMIIVCLYLCIVLLFLCKGKPKKDFLFLVWGIGAVGVIQAIYLLTLGSFNDLIRYMKYIFMDSSHTEVSMGVKWSYYLRQFKDIALFVAVCYLISLVISLVISLLKRKNPIGFNTFFNGMLITEVIVCGVSLWGMIFDDRNQFCIQTRYLIPVIAAVMCLIKNRKTLKEDKTKVLLYIGLIPSIIGFFAVLFVTNMDVNTTLSKMFGATIVSLIIICMYMKENYIKEVSMLALLGVLFFCRVIAIRVTGCAPVTILADMTQMTSGAESGIYCLTSYHDVWNDMYDNLGPALSKKGYNKNTNLLLFSAENLGYLNFEMDVASPSVQGTAVFDRMYLEYYKEHREKEPEVIVIDASFEANPVYNYSVKNGIMKTWIKNNYIKDDELSTNTYEVYLLDTSKESE